MPEQTPKRVFTDTEANGILFTNLVFALVGFAVSLVSSSVDTVQLQRLCQGVAIVSLATVGIKFIVRSYRDVHTILQVISMATLITFTVNNSVSLCQLLFY